MRLSKEPKTFVEPLEIRIAPARIIEAGAPPGIVDIDYDDTDGADEDAIFINTETAPLTDAIAQAVGPGAAGVDDTYYLRMGPGDVLKVWTLSNGFTDSRITVKKGNVIVFLQDIDGDNEVDTNEIMGLALGANASVELFEGLPGDVVANLDEKGTKDPADDTLGFSTPGGISTLISPKQGIAGLVTGSSVLGNVIAAGNITNVRIFGNVNGILAGSAANGATFDFYPGVVGGDGIVEWTVGDGPTDDVKQGIAGASISKVDVRSVVDRIEAGDGGAGAKGGSLASIFVNLDSDGFILRAGDGGVSNAVKKNGGAGGTVNSVFIAGAVDAVSNQLVQVSGGNGGNSTNGVGGAGGAVSSVFIGYSAIGTKPIPSSVLFRDNIFISAGNGGDGKTGGKGGAMTRVDVNVATPDDIDPLVTELRAIAGNGGASIVTGKAGIGGGITDLFFRNAEAAGLTTSDILVQAGNAGTAVVTSVGAAGGAILRATVRGFDLSVHAGDGSSGKSGGNGGAITTLLIEEAPGVLARTGDITGGTGGDGASGNGGKGGPVAALTVVNSDLELFSVVAGNGGAATGSTGKGGVGGNLSNLNAVDNDFDVSVEGSFLLQAGHGGTGARGGGTGGSVLTAAFDAINMNGEVFAGNGGSVLGVSPQGKGGLGGALSKVNITNRGEVLGVSASSVAASGLGGNGGGTKGAGGAGGAVSFVNLNADGTAGITSGTGGDGSNAAPGKGGDIKSTLVFALNGDGQLIAGNGGAAGVGAAKGGSITGVNSDFLSGLFSAFSLTIKAGDGTHGGAGGSLKFIGYGSTASNLTPTPLGTINILGGNGSAEGKFAGAGGSISEVQGAIAAADPLLAPGPFNTSILAGDVIAAPGATKSAAGGSIINLDLRRGGNVDGVLLIEAGDASDTTIGAAGAKGGDVRAVAVADMDVGNIFRAVAAGDGGDGARKGGLGGSVTDIKVLGHDIGVRLGEVYGYATMGGIFAGAGGNGTTLGKNGSVTNVAAQMIASIVAGRGAAPLMAEKVSGIFVGTPTDLLREAELDIDVSEADGDPAYAAYTLASYNTNTFVGATMDPTRLNGNKFSWTDDGDGVYELGEIPTDGLVASKVFDQKTSNFTPEARFTNGLLFDHDNKF